MVGELADKSQLLALLLATRYKAWHVLIGIFIATFIVHFFTTLAGQFLGAAIPPGVIPWITGLLFIGFGIWTLRGDTIEDSEAEKGNRFGPILATTIAFFLAELGDKTARLMTLAIAVGYWARPSSSTCEARDPRSSSGCWESARQRTWAPWDASGR